MTRRPRPRVLCVDDEPLVLQGLGRTLHAHFEVTTAGSGLEAVGLLEEGPPFAVILSDMRMPEMDGVRLLTRARELSPDSVRMLLTGHADLASAVAAVNQGQIYRFLTKPCPAEDLVAALQAGAEQFRLVHAERELLSQTLTGAVKALTEVLALASPVAFGRAARVHRTVVALCALLDPPDRWAIEVAAQLSQIGAIQLPGPVAEKLYFGRPLEEAEQALVARGPGLADKLLTNIPRLEPVRAILSALAPPAPGIPAPAGPLPLGARLLRLADELDTLEASGLSSAEALARLKARGGPRDRRLVEALEHEVARRHAVEVRELPLAEVRPGMQLADDLRSRAGVLLVARGFVVSDGMLMKLQSMQAGVQEPVRVLLAARVGEVAP